MKPTKTLTPKVIFAASIATALATTVPACDGKTPDANANADTKKKDAKKTDSNREEKTDEAKEEKKE